MNTRLFSLIIFFAIIGLSACNEQASDQNTSQLVEESDPIPVQTKRVGAQEKEAQAVLSGTIQSKNKATVSARMMGYVTALKVDVGDRVSAGQTILTIENNELPAKRAQIDAGITEAKAALKNVKINYDRMRVLWEQESVTRKEWDDISAQYEMMKAKVDGANQRRLEINEVIALTNVKAPISGVVTAKTINMGDLVNPGVPLMSIEGNKGFEVLTYVSDHQITAVKKGMIMDCHVKALDKMIKAKITEVSPSAVNTGGQFAIKADLQLSPAEKKLVFPGMYANVHVDLPKNTDLSNAITVEKSALIKRGQLTGVYTVSMQNTALLRWIRVGKDLGTSVEVVSGLKAGEEYVTSDLSKLMDGVAVIK